jgi:transposase InsO family protein
MSSLAERQCPLGLIDDACRDGARLARACAQIGLSARTVQRWQQQVAQGGDRRVAGQRSPVCPHNRLSAEERQVALALINSDAFKDLPPSQIVPRLADQGQYLCSESTLYRLMHEVGQATRRGIARAPQSRSKPRALQATAPDQIYCWDITYLPASVRGEYFYLYLFEDLFSRKIVGWQVFDCESATLAAQLLEDICRRQGIPPGQVTLHSDNGSPMKGESMLATMQRLGVAASRSRPSVSNDNPYAESLFRNIKYRPQFPLRPFDHLLAARRWVAAFVHWYNHEHRHSAIRFVTPEQRHRGDDPALLENRAYVYERARQANPARWSRNTRNWAFIDTVHLNPDRQQHKETEPTRNAA